TALPPPSPSNPLDASLHPTHPHPTPTLFPYTTLFRSFVHKRMAEFEQRLAKWHATEEQLRRALEQTAQRQATVDALQADLYRLLDRKSTRLNSSHLGISYAVFCLKKKTRHGLGRRGLL